MSFVFHGVHAAAPAADPRRPPLLAPLLGVMLTMLLALPLGARPASAMAATSSAVAPTARSSAASATAQAIAATPVLRTAAPRSFVVGTAVSGDVTALENATYTGMLARSFGSITPDMAFKWGIIHPTRTTYAWGAADRMVALARANHQLVRGHTLLWDGALPDDVRAGARTCAGARTLLQQHITTVVSHYRGRIWQWDVANEVIDPDGHPRAENPFVAACGLGIVADAFRWAHAADPAAKLYLNDYNILGDDAKARAEYALARSLVAAKAPINGIGFQGHLQLGDGVPTTASSVMMRYAKLGLDVMVTEADVRMPVAAGATAPTSAQSARQAAVYRDLLATCLRQARCVGFTVWGFTDHWSWVPGSLPGQGFACLSDSRFRPRPAWAALRARLAQGR